MESGGQTPPRIRLWSLSEDALVEADLEHDRLVVVTRWGETRIDDAGDLVRESLRRMNLGPISLENVLPRRDSADRPGSRAAEWARLGRVIDLLGGSVVHSLGLQDSEGPLLSAVPIARQAMFRLPEVAPELPIRLSRFASIRAADGELLVESPLAHYNVLLHRSLASQVVTTLSAPIAITRLAASIGVEQSVVADIAGYLVATGIVLVGEWDQSATGNGSARFIEDEDPALLRWSHHDLLFHSRSRMGHHGGPTGAVYPHAGRLPAPPVTKPQPGPKIRLYRPPLVDPVAGDRGLTDVLENTRLCPELSEKEVSADQLGELLYRAARIRSVSPAPAGTDVTYDISDRPYLSIYGLYELELYLSLHNCDGLPRGIYHYDPLEHAVTLINDSDAELGELLDGAMVASGATCRPPALISITARAARASWMYGGIAYSLTLTHVGALQQILCLVATALGLAPCVPAVDPGDVTDRALHMSWPAEIGVGEFIVGHRRRAGTGSSIGL